MFDVVISFFIFSISLGMVSFGTWFILFENQCWRHGDIWFIVHYFFAGRYQTEKEQYIPGLYYASVNFFWQKKDGN